MVQKDRVFREGRWLYATYQGQTKTLSQWAREKQIPYQQVWQRIYRHHWSVELALTEPLQAQPPRMHGTADMVLRAGCRCKDCKVWMANAKTAKAKKEVFVPSLAPCPEDEGRWFDKGRVRYIKYRNQTLSIPQWAKKLGMVETTLRARLFVLKMPVKKALGVELYKEHTGLQHGTKSGYDYWKCRCELCRQANSEYYREYAARKAKEKAKAAKST